MTVKRSNRYIPNAFCVIIGIIGGWTMCCRFILPNITPCDNNLILTPAQSFINNRHNFLFVLFCSMDINQTKIMDRLFHTRNIAYFNANCTNAVSLFDIVLSDVIREGNTYDWIVLTTMLIVDVERLLAFLNESSSKASKAMLLLSSSSPGTGTFVNGCAGVDLLAANNVELLRETKLSVKQTLCVEQKYVERLTIEKSSSNHLVAKSVPYVIEHLKIKIETLLVKRKNLHTEIARFGLIICNIEGCVSQNKYSRTRYLTEWSFVDSSGIHSLDNYNRQPLEVAKYRGRSVFPNVASDLISFNHSSVDHIYSRQTYTLGNQVLYVVNKKLYQLVQTYEDCDKTIQTKTRDPNLVIILPLYRRSNIFIPFLKRLESVAGDFTGVLTLQAVIYKDKRKEFKASIKAASKVYNNMKVNYILSQGTFSRSKAIAHGLADLNDNARLLIMDVDMIFSEDFLDRVVKNTIQRKQAFFPIYFSKYDPRMVHTGSRESVYKKRHMFDKSFGMWRYFSFGIVGIYKSDLEAIGNFNMDIHGWGKEDVELYNKCVLSSISVFRAPDSDLFHLYHHKICSLRLTDDQRGMCLDSKMALQSSQLFLAGYVLDVMKY